jgi:hypothetical protein
MPLPIERSGALDWEARLLARAELWPSVTHEGTDVSPSHEDSFLTNDLLSVAADSFDDPMPWAGDFRL